MVREMTAQAVPMTSRWEYTIEPAGAGYSEEPGVKTFCCYEVVRIDYGFEYSISFHACLSNH